MFEAKPGPGFIAGQVLYSFNNWNKLRSQNAAAAADNSLVSNLHNVNNSKVDVTHLSTVIVDHCNGGLVHYIYVHFLLQFSPHSVLISDTAREKSVVIFGDVPANPDRIQAVQPRFLASTTASVSQYLVVAKNEDVGDKLLETSVLLSIVPVQVHQPLREVYHT